jgi:hypothetical protein
MSVTLTAQAGLGAANAAVSLTVPITGTAEKQGEVIPLTGAQTYTPDLAMLPTAGAQGLLVSVDRTDAAGLPATAPVRVTLTPGGYVDVMPGGFIHLASPGIAAGVTAMTLASTANAVARLTLIG